MWVNMQVSQTKHLQSTAFLSNENEIKPQSSLQAKFPSGKLVGKAFWNRTVFL